MNAPILSIRGVQKAYSGLRPLRIQNLAVAAGERVAVGGIDGAGAEVLVNLVTGATLPDAGSVTVFGRSTAEITDGDAWLASLDVFGMVSPRAVLLEGSTLQQNLALPFTLEIESLLPTLAARVEALAAECGIPGEELPRRAGELAAHVRVRAHLARALALEPQLVLIEHPTADVVEQERPRLGRDLARALESRRAAALIVTMDVELAEAVAHRSLTLQPATGALIPWRKKRGWLR